MVHWTGPTGLPGWLTSPDRLGRSVPTDTTAHCLLSCDPACPQHLRRRLLRFRWALATPVAAAGYREPELEDLLRLHAWFARRLLWWLRRTPMWLGFWPAAAVLWCSSGATPISHNRVLMSCPPGPRASVARRGWCRGAPHAAESPMLPTGTRRRVIFSTPLYRPLVVPRHLVYSYLLLISYADPCEAVCYDY
jgi:hypothetical protein